MVDPTDNTTPADTDFAKGAAAELRSIKGYLQDIIQWLGISTLQIYVHWPSSSTVAPTVYLVSPVLTTPFTAITCTVTRSSVSGVTIFTFVVHGLNYATLDTLFGLNIPAVAITANDEVDPQFVGIVNDVSQSTSAHTVTFNLTIGDIVNHITGVDPNVGTRFAITLIGNPTYPVQPVT